MMGVACESKLPHLTKFETAGIRSWRANCFRPARDADRRLNISLGDVGVDFARHECRPRFEPVMGARSGWRIGRRQEIPAD